MATLSRTPAAVSASKAAQEIERIGWQTGAREARGSVAVSARDVAPPTRVRAEGPVAGHYVGQTDEALPRHVEFRFLGTGIRDLTIDGRLVVRWIPVAGPDARGSAGDADVLLSWIGSRQVNGKYVRRGRRRRAEVLRFTATHRFRTFAA